MTSDGYCLGGTYFAIYKNQILSEIRSENSSGFQRIKWAEINPDTKSYLTSLGLRKERFDNGKMLNILLQKQGHSCTFIPCDSIIHFYNQKIRDLHRVKEKEMVNISLKGLSRNHKELDSIIKKLDEVRKDYGILDYKSQVPEITRGYMNALSSGKGSTSDAKKIQELYTNISKEGSKAIWYESRFNYLTGVIDSLNTEYNFYLSEYEKDITYSHVVEYPMPSDKKSYPVRWIIVAFSTISALFLALLVFLVLDYRKED